MFLEANSPMLINPPLPLPRVGCAECGVSGHVHWDLGHEWTLSTVPLPVSDMDMVMAEVALVVEREGLVPLRGGWYATQLELDTPHHTFRLSPR
jgi:hypothetical protein